MGKSRDRELGIDRPITRRDFLNGASLAAAGTLLPPGWIASASSAEYATHEGAGYYPPLSTGMRGSHPGSFEVAHQVRDGVQGAFGDIEDTNERYDLVVVGGGISGLAMILVATPSETNSSTGGEPSSTSAVRSSSRARRRIPPTRQRYSRSWGSTSNSQMRSSTTTSTPP